MSPYKVMDLFSGAGGLSNGFEQTGMFKVVYAVENNKDARLTYAKNHPNLRYFENDITKIQYRNENGEIKDEFKEIDIIIGGPPCQGFSNANRQKNSLLSTNNNLVKQFLRAIQEVLPIAFVMENVNTMQSEKHKFFVNMKDEEELNKLEIEPVDEFIEIGYKTPYLEKLYSFLRKVYINRSELQPYMLKETTFSKLNSFLRFIKKKSGNQFYDYLNKGNNKQLLLNLIQTDWEREHKKYWDSGYRDDWIKLGEKIEHSILQQSDLGIETIKMLGDIIDTQRTIGKFSEVIQNRIILYDKLLFIKDEKLMIHVKTFNIFNFIKRKLESLGYIMNKNYIFNAAEYGVPQERRRLILIGIHKEHLVKCREVIEPKPLFSNKKDFFNIYSAIGDLEKIQPSIDVKQDEILRDEELPLNDPLNKYLNDRADNKLFNHVMTNSSNIALERFRALNPGENFHDLSDQLKKSYADHTRTQNTIYKRLSYDKPSDTVVNVRKSMWVHPKVDRALSIREAARLQSFRDSFRFFGSKDSQYQQIGNAVPPLLARAIAESLLESLGKEAKVKIRDILVRKKSNSVTINS